MAIDSDPIKALVFDYGNTLVPYGPTENDRYGRALEAALAARFGPVDFARMNALRAERRNAPFEGDTPTYVENDLREATVELVRALYDETLDTEGLEALMTVRFEVLVEMLCAEPYVAEVLGRLKVRYKLGLLSNYPDGAAIHASLEKVGLAHFFDCVVVSGDLGFCKPHPLTFASVLQPLGLASNAVAFVGDNWLADIQGAKRVGMQAVLTTQWVPIDHIEKQAGDHEPDAVISHLTALEALLGD